MSHYCGFKGIALLNDEAFKELNETQVNEELDEFSTLEHLLGLSHHVFDESFDVSKEKPYFMINVEHKAVRFCTSFDSQDMKQFLSDLSQYCKALVMHGVDENRECAKYLYLKKADQLKEVFLEDIEDLLGNAVVENNGVYVFRTADRYFGVGGDDYWEMLDHQDFNPYAGEPLKRFLLKWTERVRDDESNFLHLEDKSEIIEAANSDHACSIWEENNQYNEDQNGLNSCDEIVNYPILAKKVLIDMPDGLTYGIDVEVIARHRAMTIAQQRFNGDVMISLQEDTVPLFEQDEKHIREWAMNEMSWKAIKTFAIPLMRKISEDEYEAAWKKGISKII